MTTASAWKYLRLAFTLSVGTRLSAASNQSVAVTPTPFPIFGRLGKGGKPKPNGPEASTGGVEGLLGSL